MQFVKAVLEQQPQGRQPLPAHENYQPVNGQFHGHMPKLGR
jgi:hypothetical protein